MKKSATINSSMLSIIFAVLYLLVSTTSIASTEYVFTVVCPDKRLVVEWGVGDIDPGKEFLRVSTGTKYPGCSVSNYNHSTDNSLPRERFSHEAALIHGIPLLGPLICGIFGVIHSVCHFGRISTRKDEGNLPGQHGLSSSACSKKAGIL